MEAITKANNLIISFQNLKNVLFDNFSDRDVTVWCNRIQRRLISCHRAIRRENISLDLRRRLQTTIQHLKTLKTLIKHTLCTNRNSDIKNRVVWNNIISCFKGRVKSGVIVNLVHKDINYFLNDAFILFRKKIKAILRIFPTIKVNTTLCGRFIKKGTESDTDIIDLKYFNTRNAIIDLGTDLEQWFFEHVYDKVLNKLSEFQEHHSGFALQQIIYLEININKFEMGNGSSYIKLPNEIERKKACINIKNNDHACFFWAIVSALFPTHNNYNLTSSYPYYRTVLNIENLPSPMTLDQIPKFEKNNNISVNVYALELIETKRSSFFNVVPARLTKNKLPRHVNLLLVQDKYFPKLNDFDTPQDVDIEDINIKYHYCWIKHLSRLLHSQLTKHKNKLFFCDRCLNHFFSEDNLTKHEILCAKFNEYKVTFPKYEFIEFKNFIYKQKCPFIIYADFECQLIPLNETSGGYTQKYQRHEAFSAGFYLKCTYDDSFSHFKSYRGTNCVEWFVNEMIQLSSSIYIRFKNITPMVIDSVEDATHCHICELRFKSKDVIVHDHDHFTGRFRGFAHQACNLNFKKQFMVPVVFHNLSGYDSHFLIKELAKRGNLSVLPVNKERFISFTYHHENGIKFRFIDSLRFMGASLDTLTSTLAKDDFKILRLEFPDLCDESFNLLTRKGVFPYDYIDNLGKLSEEALPSIDQFFNKLDCTNISEENYKHAQKVWNAFKIQNLGQYSDLYLKTDILGLADVFETFRDNSIKSHKLDPAWYYSIPGYSWDAMLFYCRCKLELLRDIDQIMFIEQGIRGGLSVCVNRYAEANNKYTTDYDPSKHSNYLLYLDVNNLYGKAMTEPLPYGGFEWCDVNIDVMTVPDDSPVGYILQVDLTYPESLHDLHKDFPFCPEHRVPPGSKLPKLLSTLHSKQNYILHYRNLKQALESGLKLTKIHKVLKFKQSRWLEPYIELNNRLRILATTTFGKNNFKLYNNAIFGKSCENIRKHRAIRIVRNWTGRYGAKNLIASHRFHSRTILDENIMTIELHKSELMFNKPLYIGMSILDISKLTMFNFHYGFMIPKMGLSNCKLLYTDTDSFIYDLKCDDVFKEIIKPNLNFFDTSDYPVDNVYNISRVNKKVLGLMKDEVNGSIITHFVGLRSKMYTFKIQGGRVSKRAKGIKYDLVKNKLTFRDYFDCLKGGIQSRVTQRTIRSYSHNIFSIEQTKIALSPHDDKRHLLPNSFDTLPFGHYKIK